MRNNHDITLEEIFSIILRRKYGILLILFVFLSASLFYHYRQTPEYRAVSIMMINSTKGQGDLLSSVIGISEADNKAVRKDVELLKSMPIAQLVVKELYNSSIKDSLEFFGKRRYISPVDRKIGKFLFIKKDKEKTKNKLAFDDELRGYAVKLNHRIIVESIRETNILKVSVLSPFPDEATFLTNTLCRVYKEADIARNSEKYSQARKIIADMLEDQKKKVVVADDELSKYMELHKIYEMSGNMQQLLEKVITTDAKYNDILVEYNIAKNHLDFLEKKLSESDKAISMRIAESANAQLGSIIDEMRKREREYVNFAREKGFNNSEVKAMRQRLDVIKTRYEHLYRSKIAGEIGYAGRTQKYGFNLISEKLQFEQKLNDLSFTSKEYGRLKQYYESQLLTLPRKQQDYAKLLREREVVNKTYFYLKEKYDETRLLLGSEVGSISLVGTAFRPFSPDKPDISKSFMTGFILGCIFAGIYSVIAEKLDDSIKDKRFFKDLELRVLAVIPLLPNNGDGSFSGNIRAHLNRIINLKNGVLGKRIFNKIFYSNHYDGKRDDRSFIPKITDQMSSVFSESFRTLRTALDYSKVDSPLKSIVISGAAMSEGKSTVCANLGMAIAITGKKTLIIDCDLRRASQHEIFNCSRQDGLTDYLFSQHQMIGDLYIKPTHVEHLFLLTAGNKIPNGNDILSSPKMFKLIKEFESRFDMILIDSPPFFLSDVAMLLRSVDGVLLSARLYFTSRKHFEEFVADSFIREHLLGVALVASNEHALDSYSAYDEY
ncbi:MAG: polysaccharide biosynthesis tyrosine autokinase [Chlorobiaceae bacterium]|nr:polysaccharide biosynthesis tyrosine autokinase [Chlorobiaceae bacterium]